MAHFPKPAEGSWTEHYPELGTAPVSYEDSISPEHYELERDAIFSRTWLNVGRVEQLPRIGSYFTKEIDAARTSVVVVRGNDGEVRAFHNICRHRGNKLVWNDYPGEETDGTCRQFTCKYHGWRYDLEGDLTFVQQESEFFDLDKADYGLVAGAGRGVGGVHLREPRSRQHDVGAGVPGRARCRSRRLPVRQDDPGLQVPGARSGATGSCSSTPSPSSTTHLSCTRSKRWRTSRASCRGSGSRRSPTTSTVPTAWSRPGAAWLRPRISSMVKPIERVLRSGLFGPWDRPDIGIDELPRGSTRPATRRGASTRSCSSPTSCCWCGRRTGTSPTTTGRRPTTRTSSRAPSTSSRRRRLASVSARSSPP